ncbi:MAG: LapA family protein [Putridiphycobacter sp.]|nr:LapA family protein [Putridiphycobacter sp.]
MATERTTTQKVKLIAGLVLLLLIAIIIIQNLAAVELTLLFWKVNISLFVLTAFNLFAGFILGWLYMSRKYKKQGNLVNKEHIKS